MVKTTLAELYGCERTEKWQKCSNQNWHHAFINLAGTWVQYLQQLLVKYDMANESLFRLQLLDEENEENQEAKEKQLQGVQQQEQLLLICLSLTHSKQLVLAGTVCLYATLPRERDCIP